MSQSASFFVPATSQRASIFCSCSYSAYNGAVTAIADKATVLASAAAIHNVEAYHAGTSFRVLTPTEREREKARHNRSHLSELTGGW